MNCDRTTTRRIFEARVLDVSDPASMKDVGIQAALQDPRSSSEKYQDLVVGSRGFFRLIHFELVMLLSSWVPGALGLLLRKLFYPTLLGSCGRGVVFGLGVALRHPHKIHIGQGTVIDDNVLARLRPGSAYATARRFKRSVLPPPGKARSTRWACFANTVPNGVGFLFFSSHVESFCSRCGSFSGISGGRASTFRGTNRRSRSNRR